MNKSRLLALLLLGLALPALAAEEEPEEPAVDWYDVEVIIFRHHDLEALSRERWQRDPGSADIRTAVELLPPLPEHLSSAHSDKLKGPIPYVQLNPAAYQMVDKFEQLRDAAGYEPLIHLSWRQPGLGPDQALPIHIHGGSTWAIGADVAVTAQPLPTPLPGRGLPSLSQMVDTGMDGPPAPVIDGTLRLIRKRFLHVEADLVYRAPYVNDPENHLTREQWPQAFRLTETRRMRSREVHYFDHPMFGMLVLATPYQVIKSEPAVVASPPQPLPGKPQDPLTGTIRR